MTDGGKNRQVTKPQDRVGVFLVPATYTAELEQAQERIAELEFPDDGSVGPPEWRVARHELFERLLAVAAAHRVLPFESIDDVLSFTTSFDKRNRRAWDEASPSLRRELTNKHLAKVTKSALRDALSDVLAHDAGPDAGLWIESEIALQPTAEDSEPSDNISPAELRRRLEEYVEATERAHPRLATRHAFVCELSDADARRPATTMRESALVCVEETMPELVDALEEFCERAGVDSLAPCVYSSAQARELLEWLRTERRSATRELMMRVLRPAVANKHAFAVVFTPVP